METPYVTTEKWDRRYLELARFISTWSKDPNKKVGAVITAEHKIKGVGYNGFPRGIEDSAFRLHDKELKNLIVVHAEINAIHSADGKGDTIYVYPCLPCTQCLGSIIQYGITRVVTLEPDLSSSWNCALVEELAREAGITITYLEDL
jgi:dCMP deaminase